MKSIVWIGIEIWLAFSGPLFAQNNPPAPEQKQQPLTTSVGQEHQPPHVSGGKPAFRFNNLSSGSTIELAERAAARNIGSHMGAVEVLSDTMGVEFSPYLRQVVNRVKQNWYALIPDAARSPMVKKGKVAIEFTILKNGAISGMKLAGGGSSGDAALDRAAWRGIGASDPLPPLPNEFPDEHLVLRFNFLYNQEKTPSDAASTTLTAKSAIIVRISPRRGELVANSRQTFSANVMGASNHAVTWSVIGLDCSGSSEQCGTINRSGVYTAPQQVHSPIFIKVRAVSGAASESFDSVTVRVSPGTSAATITNPSPSR